MVRVGLREKGTPEQRAKGHEAIGQEDIRRSVLGAGNSSSEVLRWRVLSLSREQQGTSKTGTRARQKEGMRASGDDSQSVKGLLSHCLAFTFPVRGAENQCRGESGAGGWKSLSGR